MLTGLVPPCHSRHEPSVSDGPSSRCQLLTGTLSPPLNDCTSRRLRLLVQAFKGTSHNDLTVSRKVTLLSSVSIRYLSLPLVHSPNAIFPVPALATSHTRLICAFCELPVPPPLYFTPEALLRTPIMSLRFSPSACHLTARADVLVCSSG